MKELQHLVGKYLDLELSGGIFHKGTLIDMGSDTLVIYDYANKSYLYIPNSHIQKLKETEMEEELIIEKLKENQMKVLENHWSFQQILSNAVGRFVQIFVTGTSTLQGYITAIQDDYLVFHSPIYKTIYVSLRHIKWLTPYQDNETPYGLNNQQFPISKNSDANPKKFMEQCRKFQNQVIILDAGDHFEKTGLLQKLENERLTLISSEKETVFWNIEHIKTLYVP